MAYPLTNAEARALIELVDEKIEALSFNAHRTVIELKIIELERLRERLSQC